MSRKKYLILFIIISMTISFGSLIHADTFSNKIYPININNSKTVKYIIKFKTSDINNDKYIIKYKTKFIPIFSSLNIYSAELNSDDVTDLINSHNISYIQKDNIFKLTSSDESINVKDYSTELPYSSNWGIKAIKAQDSWNSGYTGKGVKIAIIDTGIGPHMDLKISGGVNVIKGEDSKCYYDDNGHGTLMAGIINGQGCNYSVIGIAPGASIYSVKAIKSSGYGNLSDLLEGINWSINNKMDIINMSLGTLDDSPLLNEAVDEAYKKGLLVVSATGNSGTNDFNENNIDYPAKYESVIAVGAVNELLNRPDYSCSGNEIEVCAPGDDILSTFLYGNYGRASGTSISTAFVSGDLALLKQKYPNYTNVQLRKILDENVVDLGADSRDSLYGYGLIIAPNDNNVHHDIIAPDMPTANIASGTYSSKQSIALNDITPGVTMIYTTNGEIPSLNNGNIYCEPIEINSSTTLNVIALDNLQAFGFNNYSNISKVLTKTFKFVKVPETPVANINSGTYNSKQIISLNDNTKDVLIYYSLDGSNPNNKSILYKNPITINSSCELKAIAIDKENKFSDILSIKYKILLNKDTTIIKNPVILKPNTNKKELTVNNKNKDFNYINNSENIYINNIKNIIPKNPIFNIGSGTYSGPITVILKNFSANTSIYYTLDGSIPTKESNLYKSPIIINKDTIISAIAINNSNDSSEIIYNKYIIKSISKNTNINKKNTFYDNILVIKKCIISACIFFFNCLLNIIKFFIQNFMLHFKYIDKYII